jgi:nitroreductase
MDTIAAIMQRRSIRKYQPRPISDEDLRAILEAGRQAPSGGNSQPWHFVIVRGEDQKRRLAEACSGQVWMANAGAIIVGLGKPSENEEGYSVDVAIAMENMIIAATALGYGTCWIGDFSEAQIEEVLGVPDDLPVVALTPVGMAAEKPDPRPRMAMAEFASAERYGVPMK